MAADEPFDSSNETLSNLTDSVNFMSDQFDVFGKQSMDVINSNKESKK